MVVEWWSSGGRIPREDNGGASYVGGVTSRDSCGDSPEAVAMAHSTHHTDTANESTLLALVEYECISASEHRRASECEWTTTNGRLRKMR